MPNQTVKRRHATGAKIVNARIREERSLIPPAQLDRDIFVSPEIIEQIISQRETIARIISGEDSRMLLTYGSCSMSHEAMDIALAARAAPLRRKVSDVMELVFRCCPMKPP